MGFEGNEYMIGGPDNTSRFIPEDQYPFLVRELLEYISEVKAEDSESSIVEVIMDYAFKNNLDVESVGDAIASDEHFKSFIETDCSFRGVFGKSSLSEEW